MKTKNKQSEQRMHEGMPVNAPPTPWWTIVGLYDGAWYERYQARSEQDGKRYLKLVMNRWEDLEHVDYEDFALLPPTHTSEKPEQQRSTERGRAIRRSKKN